MEIEKSEVTNNEISIIKTGAINLSDKIIISDPCYERGIWCAISDFEVMPGKYETFIVKYENRAAAVIAVHSDYIGTLNSDWELYVGEIGVDSGQAGIFDDSIYPEKEEPKGKWDDEDSFYGECCKLTLSNAQGGILKNEKGVVSSSGYGDGRYELFCQCRENYRIALMIDFAVVDVNVLATDLIEEAQIEH
jgi:hypothetical protein